MNRLHQIDPARPSDQTEPLFEVVRSRMGRVPNLTRVFANSPAAFEAYLNFSGALQRGVLPAKLRESIALAVGEINGCGYCLSAHTLSAGKAGLSREGILAARRSTPPTINSTRHSSWPAPSPCNAARSPTPSCKMPAAPG